MRNPNVDSLVTLWTMLLGLVLIFFVIFFYVRSIQAIIVEL